MFPSDEAQTAAAAASKNKAKVSVLFGTDISRFRLIFNRSFGGAQMKRLFVGAILVGLNCTIILAQQKDKPGSNPTTPIPVLVLAPDSLPGIAASPLSPPHFSLGQSPFRNPTAGPADPGTNPESAFVFVKGAVYVRLPAGILMPMSGGGASGCFSADLPQRIIKLDEYVPRINSPKRDEPKPQ
jgi:hypothetical protein